MKRTIFTIILLTTFFTSPPIFASSAPKTQPNTGKFSSFPSSLYEAVKAVESLPEAARLIDEVQKEGPIGIEAQYFTDSDFEALWDSENRIIYVNILRNDTLGKEISSILFELHNAKTNKKLKNLFKQATNGLIDKDSYVESVERLEFKNALNTSQLIEKGISSSLFPEDTRWEIFSDFEDHYKIQQIYGHSQWIADRFDSLCPAPRRVSYHGSIKGLDKMSLREKEKIVRLLVLKNQMKSADPLKAQEAYQKIKDELNTDDTSDSDHITENADRPAKKQLFEAVFKNTHTS